MRRQHAGGLRHDPSVVVSRRGTSLGTGDGQASARGRAAHGARERFPLRRAKPRGDLRTYVSWRVVATMLPPPLLYELTPGVARRRREEERAAGLEDRRERNEGLDLEGWACRALGAVFGIVFDLRGEGLCGSGA